jgi:hypothetical protein
MRSQSYKYIKNIILTASSENNKVRRTFITHCSAKKDNPLEYSSIQAMHIQ